MLGMCGGNILQFANSALLQSNILVLDKNYNPANTYVIRTHPWQPVAVAADSSFM